MNDPQDWTDEQQDAVAEFRYQAGLLAAAAPVVRPGIKYALGMAAEDCLMLGIDPSCITPDGYERAPK